LADPTPADLPHLWVRDRAEDRAFTRAGGGGDPKIRPVEHRAHGNTLVRQADAALADHDARRAQPTLDEELRSTGAIIVLEGADAAFPLRIESLERFTRHRKTPKQPQWLLLSVAKSGEHTPEQATIWVSDAYRARFLALFEEYLTRTSAGGEPMNRELMANISRIRTAILEDLWQSSGAEFQMRPRAAEPHREDMGALRTRPSQTSSPRGLNDHVRALT
jgi:hypothetical protein